MTSTSRKPKGAPASAGGQFAPLQRPGDGIDLAPTKPRRNQQFHSGSGERHQVGDILEIDRDYWILVVGRGWVRASYPSGVALDGDIDDYARRFITNVDRDGGEDLSWRSTLEDPVVRLAFATDMSTPRYVLEELITDPSVEVRHQAMSTLTNDREHRLLMKGELSPEQAEANAQAIGAWVATFSEKSVPSTAIAQRV